MQNSTIKRIIRHGQSYRGPGSYGAYGGYDISLLELDTPITGYSPACLPGINFEDLKPGKLAGYGKYRRLRVGEGETCQTNQFGRYKDHYCKLTVGNNACRQDAVPGNKKCRTFFQVNVLPSLHLSDTYHEMRGL